MNDFNYLYLIFSPIVLFSLIYFFYFRPNKTHLNNKLLLRNLLENFDLELPEELKRLDNSTTDPQKFS